MPYPSLVSVPTDPRRRQGRPRPFLASPKVSDEPVTITSSVSFSPRLVRTPPLRCKAASAMRSRPLKPSLSLRIFYQKTLRLAVSLLSFSPQKRPRSATFFLRSSSQKTLRVAVSLLSFSPQETPGWSRPSSASLLRRRQGWCGRRLCGAAPRLSPAAPRRETGPRRRPPPAPPLGAPIECTRTPYRSAGPLAAIQ